MKRNILAAAIVTLGLALGAGASGEAKAFVGGTLGVGAGEAASEQLLQRVDHRHRHRHHRHHHRHHGGFVINLGGLFAPHVVQSDCQQIVRDGFAYGRPAKIASTLCFDQFGRSYIVPGSDQVLQLY